MKVGNHDVRGHATEYLSLWHRPRGHHASRGDLSSHVGSGHARPLRRRASAAHGDRHGISEDRLVVKEVQVDKGITFKRYRARARGRGAPIHKHTSHIRIVLGEKVVAPVKKEAKATPTKEETKTEIKTASPQRKKPVAKRAPPGRGKTPAKK